MRPDPLSLTNNLALLRLSAIPARALDAPVRMRDLYNRNGTFSDFIMDAPLPATVPVPKGSISLQDVSRTNSAVDLLTISERVRVAGDGSDA